MRRTALPSAHRARRGKEMVKSELDNIPGVGGKRKKAPPPFWLARSVARAPVEDLMKVEGLNRAQPKQSMIGFMGNEDALSLRSSLISFRSCRESNKIFCYATY